MEQYLELKEILQSFGVDDFERMPGPAQVFLVGQYANLRKSERERSKMQRRYERLEHHVVALQSHLEHLIATLRDRGNCDGIIDDFLGRVAAQRRREQDLAIGPETIDETRVGLPAIPPSSP